MGKRRTIALLVGQAYEYYQASFIEGFLNDMFADDYDVCVFAMYEKYQNTAAREIGETSIFKFIPYERFDGFILMLDTLQTPGLADTIMDMVRARVKAPVITVDKQIEGYPCIQPRHYDGIQALISHLIEHHGYTDIAFLTGKSWHPYSKERLKAYKDCMEAHGLDIGENRIFYGDFWYTSGENLGEKLVKMKGTLPQAVACANDQMAVGLAKALTEHGLRIPEDIAVVGYDSNDEGRYAPKPLTSVTLPAKALGKHAARCITALIDGLEMPQFSEPIDMYYGSSCGCNNESGSMVSLIRSTWNTDLSSNSVFSPFNHMDEDLLSQSTFYGLMNTVFSYTYQIREFTGFSLCLNDDWQHYNTGDIRNPEPFTKRMVHTLYCGPENMGQDRIGMDDYFDRDDLVPGFDDERDKPSVFFFTPVYFEDSAYGYSVISYDEPHSLSEGYRIWLRCVMRGLEYFKRQEQLRTMNAKLEANLVRDPITGFYNYKGFQFQAEEILAGFRNGDEGTPGHIGVVAVDIKNLSGINNEHGRSAGDNAIIKLADIIRKVSEDEYVFALGNGEYFIVTGLADDNDNTLDVYISKINDMLAKLNSGDVEYTLDISYGTAKDVPTGKNDFERLVGVAINNKNVRKRNIAKAEAGGTLTEEEQEEAKIVHDIIENNKINYHFQPIVIASTGDIYAYEALMRANVVPYMAPPVVLKYAEFFNRLYDIEKATFNNVLNIFDSSEGEFAEGAKVFINSIPGHILKDSDFEEISHKIAAHTDRIVVEFTEQSEVREAEMTKIKKRYEKAGLKTAIDDYGTGYSNITNLLLYMPDYVKIDRMLLSGIQNSPQKQHFVKDIISFSHENGIMALAEGIETIEEYKTVLELGVDLVQGYFVARPSAKIVKEIDPEIKKQIHDLNRIVEHEVHKDTYIAGREGRISLPVLIEEGYSKIVLPNAEMTYRDITVSGAPGLSSDLFISVEDGYQGSLVLENVGLSGTKTGNAILIGEGCDLAVEFRGESVFENGGIRVPASSRVVFSGDGSVKINIHRLEAYGIGNALMTEHGELVFDQDGTIEINIDSAQGIGIGSGYGGDIHINRGKYIINMAGQSGVAIGSILRSTQPVISTCDLTINNKASRCVGIGSVEGDCDIYIERLSLTCVMGGTDGVGIGNLFGKKCNIGINSGYVLLKCNATDFVCVGSLKTPDTSIKLTLMALDCEYSGNKCAFAGSFADGAKINISRCTINAVGRCSDFECDFAADDSNITVMHSTCNVKINNIQLTRIDD